MGVGRNAVLAAAAAAASLRRRRRRRVLLAALAGFWGPDGWRTSFHAFTTCRRTCAHGAHNYRQLHLWPSRQGGSADAGGRKGLARGGGVKGAGQGWWAEGTARGQQRTMMVEPPPCLAAGGTTPYCRRASGRSCQLPHPHPHPRRPAGHLHQQPGHRGKRRQRAGDAADQRGLPAGCLPSRRPGGLESKPRVCDAALPGGWAGRGGWGKEMGAGYRVGGVVGEGDGGGGRMEGRRQGACGAGACGAGAWRAPRTLPPAQEAEPVSAWRPHLPPPNPPPKHHPTPTPPPPADQL